MKRLKTKKIFLIFFIVLLLLFLFCFPKKEDYLNPIQKLKEEQKDITKQTLNALNKNFKKELKEQGLMEEELQYFYAYNQFHGEIYQGRFVDAYPITYQFECNINTKEVTIKELSKRKIDEEEQEQQEAGFDPNK